MPERVAFAVTLAVCVMLAAAAVVEPADDPPPMWRGLVVAEEDRCAPYDGELYPYPASVEDEIVRRLGGIYSPYTCETFDSTRETDIEHIVARSEAHDSGLCAADADTRRALRVGPAQPDAGDARIEPQREVRQGRRRVVSRGERLLVRAGGRGCPARLGPDHRPARSGSPRPPAGRLHVDGDSVRIVDAAGARPRAALRGAGDRRAARAVAAPGAAPSRAVRRQAAAARSCRRSGRRRPRRRGCAT